MAVVEDCSLVYMAENCNGVDFQEPQEQKNYRPSTSNMDKIYSSGSDIEDRHSAARSKSRSRSPGEWRSDDASSRRMSKDDDSRPRSRISRSPSNDSRELRHGR